MEASPRQIGFLNQLRVERGLQPLTDDEAACLTGGRNGSASAVIDALLKQPKQNGNGGDGGESHADELEPGVYETTEGVFVVKPNRDGTRVYAKRLVEISAERATEAGTRVEIEFEYAPGAVHRIKPEDKMPVDRAKELTIRYGRCINCGRRLKAAQSVEQGIGPVCIKRFAA
jgi:hypothetical protein